MNPAALAGLFLSVGGVLVSLAASAASAASEESGRPRGAGMNVAAVADKKAAREDVPMNCKNDAKVGIGAYVVENNTWGKAGVQAPYRQCAGIGPLTDTGFVSARWTWQWPSGPSEIKGFPQLIFGQKPGYPPTPGAMLPMRVSDVAFARSDWSTKSTFTGTGQLTYDLWLTKDAVQHSCFNCAPITHEIMIALQPYGGYGLQRNPAWYQGEVTIDAERYKLYKADNFGTTGWRFIVLQALRDRPAGSIDLRAVLVLLQQRKLIAGTEYLTSVEFGSEPVEGTGDVFVESFRVEVR